MNTAVTLTMPLAPAGHAGAAPTAGSRQWFIRTWKAWQAAGRASAERQMIDFADQYRALVPEMANKPRTASRQGPTAREQRIARIA